jgi:tRNA modification GTPase
VVLSSVTGEGFDRLTETVEAAFIDKELRMGEEAVVFSARQAAALRETAAYLQAARENLNAGLPYDICADDIRAAMGELGMLCGRETGEEVITEIFSRFCVGK